MRSPVLAAIATALAAGAAVHAAGALDDWRQDRPGVVRHITPADIPPPRPQGGPERLSVDHGAAIVRRTGAAPQAPPGFAVSLYAEGLREPRQIRIAPNGDVFVAESGAGRVLMFPAGAGGQGSVRPQVFAAGLARPFGIAFFPRTNPQWVYVGEPSRIVRLAYRPGAPAAGPPQTIVPNVPPAHHWTRDVIVAADGQSLLYEVGSGSNEAGDMPGAPPDGVAAFAARHPLGEAWGPELGRAEVRRFSPDGRDVRVVATGLRNCVSMALQPGSGALWCVVNERDGLGDLTPPDYATSVRPGAFYGWPWFYIGGHPDPRLRPRTDLAGKVTTPDVLLQAHTAPLGLVFYDAGQFPSEYRGDAFVAMHGSFNRSHLAGYKVVRLRFSGGRPTGEVEDFLTGFVLSDTAVWGRPVGVAVARDGALLVTDDGGGRIWRVAWKGGR